MLSAKGESHYYQFLKTLVCQIEPITSCSRARHSNRLATAAVGKRKASDCNKHFSQSVLYPYGELLAIFIYSELLSGNSLSLEESKSSFCFTITLGHNVSFSILLLHLYVPITVFKIIGDWWQLSIFLHTSFIQTLNIRHCNEQSICRQ